MNSDGRVGEASVEESGGAAFDDAARRAADQLRFEPATKDGSPVPAKIRYRFDFALAPHAPLPAPPPPAPEPVVVAAAAPLEPAPLEDSGLEVSVQGERPPREPTRRVLASEEISRIPGTNGDALRSIGSMPGVARTSGFDGLLIVRGSAPQDTEVFVDGAPVPQAYHFGGLSSVVPGEMLEKIEFYPGNFGAQYGRVMGGVIDVRLRSPRKDRLGGLLQFDLIDGRFVFEGPINASTRFMVGARRSWLDLWLGSALEASGVGVTAAPVYYDYQAMLEHDLTRDTTLRFLAFGADDRLELLLKSPDSADPAFGGTASQKTGFWRVQGRAETRFGGDATLSSQLSVGKTSQDFVVGNMALDWWLLSVDARSDLRARLSRHLTAVAGLDVQWGRYDATVRLPAFTDDEEGPLFGRPLIPMQQEGPLFRPAAYAALDITPVAGLKLMPGVRVDYHRATRHWTADPRLGARYDLHQDFPRTTLKGGIGLFHQPPEVYEAAAPFGTPGLESSSAIHTSLGFEQEFTRDLELSVEVFHKDLRDLVVMSAAADTTESGVVRSNDGSGRTYGSEFLLRYKPGGRFFGWLAYTLSRSERTDRPGQDSYLFDYDQTHNLTALGSVKLGRGFQLGARFRYVTGNPYTPYSGGVMDYDAGAYSPISSSDTNSARNGAFHQLDLRMDKEWQIKDFRLSMYVDLQNAYNHQNPEAPRYNYNYSKRSSIAGLPFLPIVGVRGEL